MTSLPKNKSSQATQPATCPMGSTPRTQTFSRVQQRGFSLIELGLALAIIALIAGGVIKGRDMLVNARVQNVATQLGQFELAINSFESRYGALPGDLSTAAVAFPTLTTEANGNANDRIDTASEAVRAFQELGLAQLVTGQFDGVSFTGPNCPASTCPSTATGGRLQFITDGLPAGTGAFRALLSAGRSLDPRQLAEIDRKIDDGRATSGRFQLLAGAPDGCLSSGNWNTGSSLDTCTGVVLVQ